jgi:hypothetical protein
VITGKVLITETMVNVTVKMGAVTECCILLHYPE